MTDPVENPSPAEALEAVRRAQATVAEKVGKGSWSYDLTYSALVGVIVGNPVLPSPWSLAALVAAIAGLAALGYRWAARNGVWVSGLTPRRARWVAIGLGVVMAGMVIGSRVVAEDFGFWQGSLALGAVAALIALVASRLWLKVYRAETGAGA